ncbi:SpvB/TcaC N-terminal domain-containing protein [Amycolatopsis sp. NPDC048633]|uniref:SpvB/TcaC N-terminal domain-containing protein n=1 Tax=Amycolatopsis sp. NPDC048633 TaxID=3157095 RepID=UPI0033F7BA0D
MARGVVLLLVLALLPPAQNAGLAPLLTTAAPGAGVADVPAHPDGVSFNPNQLKGIQAADPGTGVNLIEPPTANNSGEARLGYPIELPPGRGDAQPQLSLAYNSSGTGGWAGAGWDLPVSSITIDTRWGVPRYDAGLETETYLLDGEQLTPVANRTPLQARTAEKVFHTRVEGQFRKIVRHGATPREYWWEVTDKKGTRSIFGGPATATADSTTLTDDAGDIAVWALSETRDTHDNFVRYHHVRVSDPGVIGGTVPGVALYAKKITYTGQGKIEGRYSITFTRDRERGEPRRPDVVIDGRNGFKQVTADLLRRVDILIDDKPIRSYELNYRTGAFAKTLLRSVTQFGEDGSPFTTHTFDYYDDIRTADGGYQAFGDPLGWGVPGDSLGESVPGGHASALSATTSRSAGGHLYVGFNPAVPRKSGSAGAKAGFSAGTSEGLLSLTDVNGDSLPDKVFRTGAGVFYRPNLAGPGGAPKFGDTPIKLSNLPGISEESTRSTTSGVEAYFGVAAQLDQVSTTTRTDRYLTDVNADGIADLVNDGGVLFGHLDAQGNPVYTADSNDTPVPIGSGTAGGTIVGDQTAEIERQVDAFPLLDSVRRWIAPYDGTVRIAGAAKLTADPGADRAADGVRVAVQHEDTELWAQRITARDHAGYAPSGVDSVAVHRGDRLYFRVQSVADGRFDQVDWDPDVTYTGVTPATDVNGLDAYRYLASRDFTLGGRPSTVTAPLTGTLHLSGDVAKVGPTTDDVAVVITRNGADVFSRTLPAASGTTVPIDLDIPVSANDTLSWRLKVDSPIDAGTLNWVPRAHYVAAAGGVPVVDQQGNPTLVIDPPFDLDLYPVDSSTAPQGTYTADRAGDLVVQPELALDGDAHVVFTVKRRGALLAKRVIDVVAGEVPAPESLRVTVPVAEGDELFFDYSALDTGLPAKVITQSASVSTDGMAFTPVPSAVHAAAEQGAFAQPYRGWAAIGYQGNRDRATAPIKQSDLVLDASYRDKIPGAPQESDVPGFDGRVSRPNAVVLAPRPALDRWGSDDGNTWVAAGGAASSRFGTDRIDVAQDADLAGATGVSRVARTQQVSTTFGASLPGIPIGAGASVARGRSSGQVDFVDLNGDRFPDVVGPAGIQYSDVTGGLGATRGSLGTGSVRESDSTAFTASANAGSPARTEANGRGQSAPSADRSATTAESGSELPNLGIGGSVGGGESDAAFDLLDINGDTLPDRVYADGTAALNLGYRFAAPEPWPGGPLADSTTRSSAANLGFNTDFYGLAGGVSATTSQAKTEAGLQDVTGDGLADRVFSRNGQPLSVAINTGSGFTAPTPFGGSQAGITTDSAANLGAGAYFTFGFCLGILAGGCVVFNPGADTSRGIGRAEVALRDVNGDGYADQVRSTRDDELVVAENRTGRTNLLRTVNRPLGARFELDYTRDGNTENLPQSRWVLSRTTLFDGHPGDGQDLQTSTFRYTDGRFDRLERQFTGYGRVLSEQRDPGAGDAVYRSTTSEYRTDTIYARGLLTRTFTADGGGRLFTETLNSYVLRDVATGKVADPASTGATVFPLLARTEERFYEGGAAAGKTTATENEYDQFGNLTRVLDTADTGAADDVETKMRYTATDPACRDRNIVGLPDVLDVVAVAAKATTRHRESTVDCATGDVRQVRAMLADGSKAVTDLEYLGNGNLKAVVGPANKAGQRYRLDYGYDPVVGVHIETIVDSYGYRTVTTHNYKYGLPESTLDKNFQRVHTNYDRFGRVSFVAGPYEIPENRVTVSFEYHPEAVVPYAVSRHIDTTAGSVRDDTIDVVQFTDGLDRVLQTKKDASVPPEPGADPVAVMTVSGHAVYDFAGRAVEQFYPVTEPKGDHNFTFSGAVDPVTPTRLGYDVLDRTTRTVIPDGSESATAFGFGPDRSGTTRFETVSTDANGKQRRSYSDTRELTTAVKEANPAGGQPVIWTSYGYDAMGQITSVADDRGNATKAAYDNFGRRTVVESPDSGKVETAYDLAGNVTGKVTPQLRAQRKAIQYDYEFTRLTGIRYPVFTGNDVTYTYGALGAPENGAGRITSTHDAAGTVTRGYGPLGELTRETRTLGSDVGTKDDRAKSFTTTTRYDTWNRVLETTYPDGEELTYGYDTGGQVTTAIGVKGSNQYTYLARLDYDKFEQKVLQETGSGVRTTYGYNETDRRLATLKSAQPDGNTFQNLSYGYDEVGNVTTLTNDVAVPGAKELGGPSSQTYGYDDLYRLTSATGSYRNDNAKLDHYRLDLAYDTINNTTTKQQKHELTAPSGATQPQGKTSYTQKYTYADRPHAPSKVGTDVQKYDAGGNLIDITGGRSADAAGADSVVLAADTGGGQRTQFVWNEENRLECAYDDEDDTVKQEPASCDDKGDQPTVRFVYDDAGNRVAKEGKQTHVAIGTTYSRVDGKAVKHYFLGDTRLLSKKAGDSGYEHDQFYFHADQLGSATYVTDERGKLASHQEYFAYGESWVEENKTQEPVPYQYNGKEFDKETGLYFYGARYYNPRTNLWQSADPAAGSYLDGAPNGGVAQPFNLASYSYASDNPVRLADPDGLSTWNRVIGGLKLVGGFSEAATGAAFGVAASWTGVGAVAGAVVFVHGADTAATGLRQLVSGEDESSLTSQAIQATTGLSKQSVDLGEASASFGASMVMSAATRSPQLLGMTAGGGGGGGARTVGATGLIAGGLSQPGALRTAAVEVHNLALAEKGGHIRHAMSTVALHETRLADGTTAIFAARSGGSLSTAQKARLVELGVPEANLVSGPLHAEMNILRAVPEGATQVRWGIAQAKYNKPLPCPDMCAKIVTGIIEGAE